MAIHYCEETRQFYLHTHNTSYVMELYEGLLAHSYWGRSVDSIPVLDPDTFYTDSKGNTFQGKTLMHLGIPVDTRADFKEALMVFEKQ
ncbi:MAG: GH36 C-terminal domain-containing protein [Oscillospiraceae bacterium]|nr:GH36 C-terminal domain-containing protein [Oscillospiraceae bacterium]